MTSIRIWIGVLASLMLVKSVDSAGKTLACYIANKAGLHYQINYPQFDVDSYEPNLCTHIFYMANKSPWGRPEGTADYKSVLALKSKQPSLKVLLSVQIDNPRVVATQENRRNFANEAVQLAREYQFDGIDVDWPKPTAKEANKFTEIMKNIRSTAPKDFLLSAVFVSNITVASKAYDLEALDEILDFANVKSEDPYRVMLTKTTINSPLYGKDYSVDNTVQFYLNQNLTAEKILVGIHGLGRSWILASEAENQTVGAQVKPESDGFPISQIYGQIAQNEACDLVRNGAEASWDTDSRSSFTQSDGLWYSYEDSKSAAFKAAYASRTKLGGVVLFNLDTDDWRGDCKEGKFRLVKAIQKYLK